MRQSNLARVITPAEAAAPIARPAPMRATPLVQPARRAAPKRAPTPMWPLAIAGTLLLAVNVVGIPYYAADTSARVRHVWHQWLRPSGYIGQSAGILAFAIFLFLWLYPLRKRWKSLAWTGSVGKWLDVHAATAVGLPLLLSIHAAWRSEGLIGLGFDAMLVVWASGIIGRYLYTRIPRARSGVELTREEVAKQRKELVEQIAGATGLGPADVERSLATSTGASDKLSLWTAFSRLMLSDWQRWKLARELPNTWAAMSPNGHRVDGVAVREAVRLAKREIALTQQDQLLDATHRVFKFWHVAHRPFAITALIAVVIHVAVVVAVGSTWFY